ncbi:DUF680 domain-containing protein [Mesorhizobium sp. M0293]|uniref:DUF680 domain-containing protein n=1 Tax=unclassified Mesorhizobium TaxID=325217 RepID=UPI00333DB51B
MNRIAFIAAVILVATGSAFAGSDHYGSGTANQPAVSVDHAVTGSVRTMDMAKHKATDAKMRTNWPESGQGIWGN